MACDRSMIPQIMELLPAEMFDRAGGPLWQIPPAAGDGEPGPVIAGVR